MWRYLGLSPGGKQQRGQGGSMGNPPSWAPVGDCREATSLGSVALVCWWGRENPPTMPRLLLKVLKAEHMQRFWTLQGLCRRYH